MQAHDYEFPPATRERRALGLGAVGAARRLNQAPPLRAGDGPGRASVLNLQRTAGNATVARLLDGDARQFAGPRRRSLQRDVATDVLLDLATPRTGAGQAIEAQKKLIVECEKVVTGLITVGVAADPEQLKYDAALAQYNKASEAWRANKKGPFQKWLKASTKWKKDKKGEYQRWLTASTEWKKDKTGPYQQWLKTKVGPEPRYDENEPHYPQPQPEYPVPLPAAPIRGPIFDESEAEEHAMLAGGVMRTLPPDQQTLAQMAAQTLPATVRAIPQKADTDVVFLGLHGGQGEDGTVQALLDLTGVPYTGSGHLASALAMDKDLSKRLFRDAGVPTPDWRMLRGSDRESWRVRERAHAAATALGLPLIVKPSKQGSTVGLSLVRTIDAVVPSVEEAFRFDDEVMLERFVAGRELTVGVLGDMTLPVGEIIPKHEIYDYECKYTAGMAEEIFPANITEQQRLAAQDLALRAFRALKLAGCARIDFRMTNEGMLYCLEANTLPGMTELSLIPQAAAAAGIGFPELCDRIARLALSAHAFGESK